MSTPTTCEPTAAAPPEAVPAGAPDAAALRRYGWLFAGLALVWLGCEAAALTGLTDSPTFLVLRNVGREPYFTLALGGAFFLHFGSRPGRRELLAAAGSGAAAGLVLWLLGPRVRFPVPAANAVCAGVGLASLVALARRAVMDRGAARRALAVLLPACLLAGAVACGLYFQDLSIALCPRTNDALLYAADGALGGQPSFALGRLFEAVPAVGAVAAVVYLTAPAVVALLLALYLRADPSHRRSPLPVFFGASAAGFAVYLLCPAAGPFYAFGPAFPAAPPSAAAVLAEAPSPAGVPRNCMPSLHATWALLLFWHARPLALWFRGLAAFFLAFTALATLGSGQHYLFDLVVAVPFALAAQAAFLPAPPADRVGSAVLGVVLVGAWLLVLRYGLSLLMISSWLTAGSAAATVVVAYLAERRLYRLTLTRGGAAAAPSTAPR